MRIKKVMLDMDGVISDFISGYNKIYGEGNIDKVPVEELVKQKKDFASVHLYRDLPLMKDAKRLVKFLESFDVKIEILTSVGKYSPKPNAVDKVLWVKKYFPQLVKNFNYVTKSKDKSNWAASDTLLIDDRMKSISPFRNAGGNGILYKDFSSAKKDIIKYLE